MTVIIYITCNFYQQVNFNWWHIIYYLWHTHCWNIVTINL